MNRPDDLLNALKIQRKPLAEKKRRWPWIILVIIGIGVLFALTRSKPMVVETVAPRSAASSGPATVLDASGYVTARRIATVSSKVTGKVKEVYIEEGQRVSEGEILARLDPLDVEAQRQLSKAQLASSQSQLAEARAQLQLAESTLSRNRDLASQQLVSRQALDTAKADRDARAARLASLQKAVSVSQEQLSVANLSVDNTVIRAPFDGVIIAKAAQPGEMISPISAGGGSIRTGIGTLVDMDSLEVQVDVNEAYIGRVTPEMPIEAVLNAYPDWKIPGAVIAIIPTADRSKATVKVRVALDNKDPRIVPDMGVRVSFLEKRDADKPLTGMLIANTAVIEDAGKSYVFLLREDKAVRTEITVAERNDSDSRVTRGLAASDAVINNPDKALTDGVAVRLKDPTEK